MNPEVRTALHVQTEILRAHSETPGAALWILLANRVTPGSQVGTKGNKKSSHLLGEAATTSFSAGQCLTRWGCEEGGASKAESEKHPKMGMKVWREGAEQVLFTGEKRLNKLSLWDRCRSSPQLGTKVPTQPQLRRGGSCCHSGWGAKIAVSHRPSHPRANAPAPGQLVGNINVSILK